jgi:hypothetical protein
VAVEGRGSDWGRSRVCGYGGLNRKVDGGCKRPPTVEWAGRWAAGC